jgi:septation ring formation regulator EzrA
LGGLDSEAEKKRTMTEESCAKELPLQVQRFSKTMEDLEKEISDAKYNLTQARELENKARDELKVPN